MPRFVDRAPVTVAAYPEPHRRLRRNQPHELPGSDAPIATVPESTPASESARVARAIRTLDKKLRKASGRMAFELSLQLAEHHAHLAQWARQSGDDSAYEQSMQNSIAHYRKLAQDRQYANHPQLDHALYRLAWSLQEIDDMQGARQTYMRLIRDYPKSKYIPQAFLSFAEYYFANGQMANAEKFYEKVIMYASSPVHAYALYKLGWVQMNLQRYQRALEFFYKLVTLPDSIQVSNREALLAAARKDLVLAYSHVGRPGKAHAFFKRIDKKVALSMLHHLGSLYSNQGQYRQAVAVRRQELELRSEDIIACTLQIDIAQALLAIGGRAAQVEELQNLAAIRARLAANSQSLADDRARCDQQVRTMLGETARTWHREFAATRQAPLRHPVMQLYGLYVKNFPDSPHAADNQFYLADLSWREAMDQSTVADALPAWQQTLRAFGALMRMSAQPPADAVAATVQSCDHASTLANLAGGKNLPVTNDVRSTLELVITRHGSHPAAARARALLQALDDGTREDTKGDS